jgi:hypothetical protein
MTITLYLWGLTLFLLIQMLICKVFGVGFHIHNDILNKIYQGL